MVEEVGEKVEDIGDKVEHIDDKVQGVDEKVQVVIDGEKSPSSPFRTILMFILLDGKRARVAAGEAKLIIQQTAYSTDEIKCSCLPTNLSVACWSDLDLFTGNQLKQLLWAWLSSADPSTNHNIAQKARQEGTATWLFEGRIVSEWKTSGSLLWIHGKRASLLIFLASNF